MERRALDIEPYIENTGDLAVRDGVHYADKAPGLSLLAVPPYGLVYSLDAKAKESDAFQAIASYLMTAWAVSAPSAIAAGALVWLLGMMEVAPFWRVLVGLGYVLGTLSWPYSTLFYGHQTAAALAFVAFALLAGRADCRSLTRIVSFTVGLLLGAAVLVEYPAALTAGVIVAYAVAARLPVGRLGWLVAGGMLPVGLLLAYHAAAFGGPLTLAYSFSNQAPRHGGVFMGIGAPSLRALRYLTVDPYRGLFYSSPWLLLAIPGLVAFWRSGRHRLAMVQALIPILHLWMAASLSDWHGGWGFGPRHMVLALPYMAVAVAGLGLPGWKSPRAVRASAVTLVVLSVFMIGVATAVKPEVPRAIEHPFGEYLLPRFFGGELAVNTQSVDMVTGRGYALRHAWNLGQRLGLSGLSSLLPLLAFLAVTTVWFVREIRREAMRENPRESPLS